MRGASKLVVLAAVAVMLAACGQSPSASPPSTSATTTTTSGSSSASFTWQGAPTSPTAIPLGDGKVSTSPEVGSVDSCTTSFRTGGAAHAGPWIDSATGTWNSQTKLAVQGSVSWPSASNSIAVQGDRRIITTNDLPKGYDTGTFPIATTDPAYQYDHNPNHIRPQSFTLSLPLNPKPAATPSCLGLGVIGVTIDGVVLFDALDAAGRDAGAHEIQDSCNGHPQMQGVYHYHDMSSCILANTTGSATLVGYALDGYGIYVERDAKGNLPTNADLGVCHGRTSAVPWNGKETVIYHYDVTLEYPYTVGCYHGTPITPPRA